MPLPTLHIQRATIRDAHALSRLSSAIFPLGCPADTRPEDLAAYINHELTPERFIALLADERNIILTVSVSGTLAGYAHIAPTQPPQSLHLTNGCELKRFYIDAAYHGAGISNALMQQVIDAADQLHAGPLWLSVFSGNGRAISFYTRWGFRIAGSQYFLVGADNQKDHLMIRDSALPTKEIPPCK